uniref:Non-specific serine/threonine protein kinase n=1 Tax=Globodera rostochiensis TaxID=31243 RepID=A0A914H7B7_GLORO
MWVWVVVVLLELLLLPLRMRCAIYGQKVPAREGSGTALFGGIGTAPVACGEDRLAAGLAAAAGSICIFTYARHRRRRCFCGFCGFCCCTSSIDARCEHWSSSARLGGVRFKHFGLLLDTHQTAPCPLSHNNQLICSAGNRTSTSALGYQPNYSHYYYHKKLDIARQNSDQRAPSPLRHRSDAFGWPPFKRSLASPPEGFKHYAIEEEIGSGQFAVVRRVRHIASSALYAAKFIKKFRGQHCRRGVLKAHIEREVDILRSVSGHDGVIELVELFENASEVVLVLEYVSGGELFEHVCQHEYLTESEAAQFLFQILRAVQHLHRLHIAHLDLKPENIILREQGEHFVKLIDFGLSRKLLPGSCVREMIGTPEFVAPEIINFEPLQLATDIWALGVVTFILLSGSSPFLGKTRDQTFANITAVNYQYPHGHPISELAKDFIARLLVRDVKRRATVDECLRHEWIRRHVQPQQQNIFHHPMIILSKQKQNGHHLVHICSSNSRAIRSRWKKFYAAVTWCLAYLQGIDGREASVHFKRDNSISSAIFIACERGALAQLKQLVHGCRIQLDNVFNELGESPLHVACGNGFQELVAFLIELGADPALEDGRGDTALIWAARNGHAHLFNTFILSPVLINATNSIGETALHLATRYAQGQAVLSLLERGADPQLQDKHGETPLHIAAWDGQSGLLDLLCRFCVELNFTNLEGDSALHVAASRGHLECVESLVENGANLDEPNQNGQVALHLALSRGHVEIALLLLSRGCKPNVQDRVGDTPLHIAAERGLSAAAQTLCQLGIPVDVQNAKGFSALHLAARHGHIDIVRCLCLSGASVHLKSNDGMTAEIMALAQEQKQIATLLAKVRPEKARIKLVKQLSTMEGPLRRIKLKVFGHPGAGKTRLVQALQRSSASSLNSLMESVSRRFSDNLFPANSVVVNSSSDPIPPPLSAAINGGSATIIMASPSKSGENADSSADEGIHSGVPSSSSTTSSSSTNGIGHRHKTWPCAERGSAGRGPTQGIDIQNVAFPECGEFSVWDFSGHEPFHICYDHFVGNTDCVHLVVTRCSDDPTDEYKELLYWLNFLKGRVTPSEPIGHCGQIARRSVVAIAGTFMGGDCPITRNEAEAMMRTLKMRFETHFDIHGQLFLVDLSAQVDCAGSRELRTFLARQRDAILMRLQRPLRMLDETMAFMDQLREQYAQFPCITWPYFTTLIRSEVNPLASDGHCRQLIQQLQLIGEVVYLRDEGSEIDFIVLSPDWLGTHLLGTLFSPRFAHSPRASGRFSLEDFGAVFPEVTDPADMLQILETLQLCCVADTDFEFTVFISAAAPQDVWLPNRPRFVYGGLRIKPARGMEQTMQSIFPRIQVALRRSMQDFQDPIEADLAQWRYCSKMLSGKMEALIRLVGEAVEIQIRGPPEMATSCIYYLEDLANLVEQTGAEVAPGVSTERHFLSPAHLREHKTSPAMFTPETIMEMQQNESLIIVNSEGEEEEFTDVVCFGSKEAAGLLTLGVDISVSQLQLSARSELAALLDAPNTLGMDWSIMAVKLNLTEQIPEVDSSGQSLSRTDQLLTEWALHSPDSASVGKLASILQEMGRNDVKELLFRRVPLYLFSPVEQPNRH